MWFWCFGVLFFVCLFVFGGVGVGDWEGIVVVCICVFFWGGGGDRLYLLKKNGMLLFFACGCSCWNSIVYTMSYASESTLLKIIYMYKD